MSRISWLVFVSLACGLTTNSSRAQEQGLIAKWSFHENQDATVHDGAGKADGTIGGFYSFLPGVSGAALRFDGYTTSITVSAKQAPQLSRDGFTVDAWIALDAYPWNWVPVVDQQKQNQEGFSFGIDDFGHLGLQASINGEWKTVASKEQLPLKKWAHISGTFQVEDGSGTLKVYVDGQLAGTTSVGGQLAPADTEILIGRVRTPVVPFPEGAIHSRYPVWYSLDGLLSKVEIFNRALSATEIASAYAAMQVSKEDVLPWQKMPSGPPGAGPFGAYYANLHYQDTWDRLRRIGPDSDVVVRFDESPIRLVFWQGTNYVPAWVTENDKWYSDEFLETWGKGCPLGGDCEPMSDKQERYSHVNVIETDDARAVVHWRYALSEVEDNQIAWLDPYTGWGDWADEYWTVYPDGIAVREQVLQTTDPKAPHEWQETIVLNQPGSRPEDNINWDAMTLENMQGETKTYHWNSKPPGRFSKPDGPSAVTGPANPNIQLVNLKSEWKPFQIVSPEGASAEIYNGGNTNFSFLCWNHWPVAQIASSGRACVAPDRASHTSLSHLIWKSYATDGNSQTKLLLAGLTNKSAEELIPLARSWLSSPTLQVRGEGYKNGAYDPAQRAYVVTREGTERPATLNLTFEATNSSPLYDPAIVIRNWGKSSARLEIDGSPVAWGESYRCGHIPGAKGDDLVVWIQKRSTERFRIAISPASGASSARK